MLASEFGDVALQMLRRHLVERPVMRSLEHRPERLYSIGVRLTPDIFVDRVIDGLMLEFRHPSVGRRVICVDRRARLGVLADKALQRRAVRPTHDLGPNLVAIAILDADHRRLSDRATALVHRLALAKRHVPALAAEVALVDFNRAVELVVIVFRPGFADTVKHEPRGRLRHADIALQLHGRNRFQAGQAQVDRNGPLAQRDFRPLHGGARLHAEIGAAVRAPVGHLRVAGLAGADRSAFGAMSPVRPNDRLEPLGRSFLGREHVHQINDGHPFAMGFAGCLLRHFHSPFLPLVYRDAA